MASGGRKMNMVLEILFLLVVMVVMVVVIVVLVVLVVLEVETRAVVVPLVIMRAILEKIM
jgi:hypothetical protein